MNPARIPGVLVSVDRIGVLIRGPSGSGKSYAALSLLRKGHHLVADDVVEVVAGPAGKPLGRSVEKEVRIEVRGLGIFQARSLFHDGVLSSSQIDLVIELDAYDPPRDAGRTEPETGSMHLLGCDLPVVRVPVPHGVDPGLLIELVVGLSRENGTV